MGPTLTVPIFKRSRAASAPCEGEHERCRKRLRSDSHSSEPLDEKIIDESECSSQSISLRGKEKQMLPTNLLLHSPTAAVIEDLAQELKCGCCTELLYNPVIVNPCQHYFCGSCCTLWVRNGGTNCPACRSVSSSVTPSRILQSMIDLLVRSDPSKARTESERTQADKVYRAGSSLCLPTPRPATPQPNLEPPNDNFARPCPTCLPGNPYGWRCPVPIPDPAVDQEHAIDLDEGMPTGHNFCGNCDQLHNLNAPTSSKCDLCQVSFCGVGIQSRCCAVGLARQEPHGMTELEDLILSGSIYDSFQKNSVEIDILVDYLRVNDISLIGVYKEILMRIMEDPRGFKPLIDSGIFDDLHPVAGGDDPDPTAQRRKICRLCAGQVFIYGLKEWWVRERNHGCLPADVLARKDCPHGSLCILQDNQAHAKHFNHIIPDAPPVPSPPPPVTSSEQSSIDPPHAADPNGPSMATEPTQPHQQEEDASSLPPDDVDMLFSVGPPEADSSPQSCDTVPRSSQAEVESLVRSSPAVTDVRERGDVRGQVSSAGADENTTSGRGMPHESANVRVSVSTGVEDVMADVGEGASMLGQHVDVEVVKELLGARTPPRTHVLSA